MQTLGRATTIPDVSSQYVLPDVPSLAPTLPPSTPSPLTDSEVSPVPSAVLIPFRSMPALLERFQMAASCA